LASRRVRSLNYDEDFQALKLGARNANLANPDMQILFTKKRKPPQYAIVFGAHYIDDGVSDGLSLSCYLEKNRAEIIHGANCTIRVYDVDLSTWAETLLGTKEGSIQSDGKFIVNFSAAEISNKRLDGDAILAIDVRINRFDKTYRTKEYLNDTGLSETVLRIRRRVILIESRQGDRA
jgi:hypothetical protein